MKALILLSLLCTCSAALAQTRRALVVGINHYSNPGDRAPPYRSARLRNLHGAVADAEAMKRLLTERLGFSDSDVHLVLGPDATRERILGELRDFLVSGARKDDVRVFYFAGHGAQVRNSASADEIDKLDESIVPADVGRAAGIADIRDKELARILGRLDPGVRLTVIFDSCHSGSAARGLPAGEPRSAPIVDFDVKDGEPAPAPEDRGALVLSAAQDYELAVESYDAHQHPRGVFTMALEEAIARGPRDEPVEHTFARLRAILQRDGHPQIPVLGANRERRRLTLLGGPSRVDGATPAIAVGGVAADGTVRLESGLASFGPGSELVTIEKTVPVTIRVIDDVELTRAKGRVVAGPAGTLAAGDLLRVQKWIAPVRTALRVFVPGATLPAGDALRAARQFAALKSEPGITWVERPDRVAPSHVIQWDGRTWTLAQPDGTVVPLTELSAPALAARIKKSWHPGPACAGEKAPRDRKPAVLVALPPTPELASRLRFVDALGAPSVTRADEPAGTQYSLVGRLHDGRVEYAWVQPGVGTCNLSEGLALPMSTDWVPSADPLAAATLIDLAGRLGRIRGWLDLPSSPLASKFPYRLVLRNRDTGAINDSGRLHKGERYEVALRALPSAIGESLPRQFVYVFLIDSKGRSQLAFPRTGGVENTVGGEERVSAVRPLGGKFTVDDPLGVDNYVLLATATPLSDPSILEFDGVARNGDEHEPENGLERLLLGVGTRSGPEEVPLRWSIQISTIKSE